MICNARNPASDTPGVSRAHEPREGHTVSDETRHSDVLGVLEAAALAGGTITCRSVRRIDASRVAEHAGWVTVTPSGDVVTVSLTAAGAAYLNQILGDHWQMTV